MTRISLRNARPGVRTTSATLRVECLEQRQMLTANGEWLPLVGAGDAVAETAPAPTAEPAIVMPSGNPNNDAASLLAAGGPGDPALPGFANVARSGNYGSVVYLGAGWVLTAYHVTLTPTVSFAGSPYTVDMSSVKQLKNPDGSVTDLKMFKINGEPPLPALYSSFLASAPPSGHVFMVGNGPGAVRNAYWHADKLTMPWTWTETTQPSNPGNNDYGGVVYASPNTIRWGENTVNDTGVQMTVSGRLIHGFTTQFDSLPYTGQNGLPNEAQAASGDSGGAVFANVNGQWVLSGIMIAVSVPLSGQPASTSMFDSITLMADLSVYRSQILSTIGVADRHLFYNGSYFDGDDLAANAADDDAIATDKSAYLTGAGVAVVANVSNYAQGINGIMVDLVSLHGTITAADFDFKVGNDNSPESWVDAPEPSAILVRPGAGVGGSDRVEITWPDRSISNKWLQVTVRGDDPLGGFNTNTGLAKSDVFYWGSKVADSGTSPPADRFETTASDSLQIYSFAGTGKPVTDPRDYNRDGMISSSDALVVFSHAGSIVRLDLPLTALPAAVLAVEDELDADELPAIATSIALESERVRSRISGETRITAVEHALTQLRDVLPSRSSAPQIPVAEQAVLELDLPPSQTAPRDEFPGRLKLSRLLLGRGR